MSKAAGQSVSYLDRDAWRSMVEATTAAGFCDHWLQLQCMMIRDVQMAVVLVASGEDESFEPVAFWPHALTEVSATLKRLAEQALDTKQGIVSQGGQGENSAIGYPVWSSGKLQAIVLFEIAPCAKDELRALLRTLQWGASWLDNFFLRQATGPLREAESEQSRHLQHILLLLAHTLEQRDFDHACMLFVNELCNQLGCDRVSLGLKKRGQMAVQAMSHSTQMNKKMNLVRDIAEAMDEVADQGATVHYPHDQNYLLITHAHQNLVQSHGATSILSLPLKGEAEELFGILILEYNDASQEFDEGKVRFCEALTALLGPVLHGMQKNYSPLWNKVGDSYRRQWAKLIGEEYMVRKFVVGGLLFAVVFFSLVKTEYRVSGKAEIQGELRREIVAPFNGYIKSAYARVGDKVSKDALLVTLDDEDLRLERLKWVAKRGEYSHRYEQAQAKHDLAESKLAQAQMEQAEAELDLVNERIGHTQIKAPFNGLIVNGDLSQSLGAVVKKGDVLFDLTPLRAYRVIIKVNESDITAVRDSQQGKLYLTSMPGRTYPFHITRITPVSVAAGGINYFKVEGKLSQQNGDLRPGMEGVGKIDIGKRNIFWNWTHSLFDWLRLKLWDYFGFRV